MDRGGLTAGAAPISFIYRLVVQGTPKGATGDERALRWQGLKRLMVYHTWVRPVHTKRFRGMPMIHFDMHFHGPQIMKLWLSVRIGLFRDLALGAVDLER